jgi:hypothetical protein
VTWYLFGPAALSEAVIGLTEEIDVAVLLGDVSPGALQAGGEFMLVGSELRRTSCTPSSPSCTPASSSALVEVE